MIKNYLKSSLEELTKVTWPTKNQAVKLTIIVLIFCIVVALFLGIIDYLFSQGYNYLLSVTPKETITEIDFTEAAPEFEVSVEEAVPMAAEETAE